MRERECPKSPDGKHRWLRLPVGYVCQLCQLVLSDEDVPESEDAAVPRRCGHSAS